MSAIDSQKSDIKMVMLKKPGLPNKVWYSYTKYNGRSPDFIIKGMLERFKKSSHADDTYVVQFYDNHSGRLLVEYKS